MAVGEERNLSNAELDYPTTETKKRLSRVENLASLDAGIRMDIWVRCAPRARRSVVYDERE
jgi:hypothetical protein